MNADGSQLTNMTNHEAHDKYPEWSPDGSKIAFMSDRDQDESDDTVDELYVMNTDGSLLTLIGDPGAGYGNGCYGW